LEELHDLALEVARQTLAADSEFPQLMGLAKQLISSHLREGIDPPLKNP
jgi:hypothetical protein